MRWRFFAEGHKELLQWNSPDKFRSFAKSLYTSKLFFKKGSLLLMHKSFLLLSTLFCSSLLLWSPFYSFLLLSTPFCSPLYSFLLLPVLFFFSLFWSFFFLCFFIKRKKMSLVPQYTYSSIYNANKIFIRLKL